jgi:hypothetical protein
MTTLQISTDLDGIATSEDFAGRSAELVDRWASQGAGVEVVEPILRFMEQHPAIEFGTPEALVHFVERFYRRGYEDLLVESLLRRPTGHTAWMLNRIVNGTRDHAARDRYISVMRQAKEHQLADTVTRGSLSDFLARLG